MTEEKLQPQESLHIVKTMGFRQKKLMLLGGTRDRAALVQGAILHAALVHSSDDVKVALVAPRGGPRVGDSPVLQKKESRIGTLNPET